MPLSSTHRELTSQEASDSFPQGTLLSFSPSDMYPADQKVRAKSNLFKLLPKQMLTAVIVTYFGSVTWVQQGQLKWGSSFKMFKKNKKNKIILNSIMIAVCLLKMKFLVHLYS